MVTIERELDRVLTLLRNKIRERGFTQLEVQEALGWGRSYISQLLTKQKSLRIEQVLLILNVIGVDANDFFDELYHFTPRGSGGASYLGDPASGRWSERRGLRSDAGHQDGAGLENNFKELRALVRGLIGLLTEKGILETDEVRSAARSTRKGSNVDDF